jgi:hypothetical protein
MIFAEYNLSGTWQLLGKQAYIMIPFQLTLCKSKGILEAPPWGEPSKSDFLPSSNMGRPFFYHDGIKGIP